MVVCVQICSVQRHDQQVVCLQLGLCAGGSRVQDNTTAVFCQVHGGTPDTGRYAGMHATFC